MKYLRIGMNKHKDYFGFSDFSTTPPATTKFIVHQTGEPSAMETNLAAIRATAPLEEPKRENYPNAFAFLKAQIKWKIVQTQGQGTSQ